MDAEDLDYRARTQSGCIPPDVVMRLIELGHTDEVELQAGRGKWFCALELARRRPEQAAALLAPFVATGWWTAARAMAELLEAQGRVGEAIDLVRPFVAAGHRHALHFHGGLLTRHGRAGEAAPTRRRRYCWSSLPRIGRTGASSRCASITRATGGPGTLWCFWTPSATTTGSTSCSGWS
ncbi:hypothetical protein [Dactylosporangium sp. NPDC050588]|uniref:hypothetical protein n=1 Tax=Dactylosporangium sp. NPDC050588 TaxID=3157211 RepID=UPI0033EE374C